MALVIMMMMMRMMRRVIILMTVFMLHKVIYWLKLLQQSLGELAYYLDCFGQCLQHNEQNGDFDYDDDVVMMMTIVPLTLIQQNRGVMTLEHVCPHD